MPCVQLALGTEKVCRIESGIRTHYDVCEGSDGCGIFSKQREHDVRVLREEVTYVLGDDHNILELCLLL